MTLKVKNFYRKSRYLTKKAQGVFGDKVVKCYMHHFHFDLSEEQNILDQQSIKEDFDNQEEAFIRAQKDEIHLDEMPFVIDHPVILEFDNGTKIKIDPSEWVYFTKYEHDLGEEI